MNQSFFNRRPRLAVAILTGIALVVGLGTMEVCLRLFFPLPARTAVFSDPQTGRYIRLREHVPNTASRIERDGQTIDFRIDSNGFIMPSKVHDAPAREIVFLGGSTTEAIYVPEPLRFPYLVGRTLEDRLGIPINSYNAGVSGNHSVHLILVMIAKIIRMNPDVVVFMENMNDITTTLILGDYWTDSRTRGVVQNFIGAPPQPRAVIRLLRDIKDVFARELYGRVELLIRLLRHSSSADGAIVEVDEFEEKRGRQIPYNADFVLERQYRSLSTFVEMSRAWGIRPVLMTQGNRLRLPLDADIEQTMSKAMGDYGLTLDQYVELYRLGNENIRRVARALDVPLIDLDAELPKTAEYFYDGVHLTAKGSTTAAQVIARDLSAVVAEAR